MVPDSVLIGYEISFRGSATCRRAVAGAGGSGIGNFEGKRVLLWARVAEVRGKLIFDTKVEGALLVLYISSVG